MDFPRMLYRVGAEGMAYLRVANESDLTEALAGGWHRRRVDAQAYHEGALPPAEAAASLAAPDSADSVAVADALDATADEPKRRPGRPRKVIE
jgi:hypothetical protein